jgi:hypothetical protein
VEVRNTRGSIFILCARSRADEAFPRYPRLPVLECEGHEPCQGDDGQRSQAGSGAGSG